MKIQYKNKGLTVLESQLFRTTTTVLETLEFVLIVDPNWLPNEISYLQNLVAEPSKYKPLYILFTHSDYDHIIGYEAFPNAKVISSEAFVNNENKEKILQQINDWDDENYIKRTYPITYPKGDIIIKNNSQQLIIGSTTLTFYLAPGHNADGLFTIIEPIGIWIAGDYLSNIEFPYIYHSSYEYESTLHKVDFILNNHFIDCLITGHGDMAFSHQEILKRKSDNLAYIKELRKVIAADESFDFENLMKAYQFPKIMRQFHDGNVKLLEKEHRETTTFL